MINMEAETTPVSALTIHHPMNGEWCNLDELMMMMNKWRLYADGVAFWHGIWFVSFRVSGSMS